MPSRLNLWEKQERNPRVASRTRLLHPNKQAVAVAVCQYVHHVLDVAARLPLTQ